MKQRKRRVKNPEIYGLSLRELDVLNYCNDSLTYAEIGRELGISVNTVKTHIRNMMKKLNVNSKAKLLAKTEACGILQLSLCRMRFDFSHLSLESLIREFVVKCDIEF